ncbi:nitrite/sulfite reductase [Oceanicella actignis]|uniref:Sulfite reductase (NADPH) hemoprotein beta-component n=1 Tax=Oceanicella actignis TaxID=1189325 RepID=A0A1M7TUI6_9RHOB|nr:nitrite/sulfite reductase [Oceanicella actignis]TYO90509.1 sulfite reductase (NADPH) hemoprotein beta-component [Oceanicella actignis]SES78336.1 sulfite reductase (NADPH) hemoprotein beta-component [Oceanicella actignis]SHN74293.1 sulfite reductase (NADPH) hemoprotein beta-component [Oceanicella actignis]
MYRYDEFDAAFVAQRAAQFREQVRRRLSGALTEDEFRPLRLMNGVYLQLHAYMLRVAIPYGTLDAEQMRMLAHVAEKYDRGYGHFTTRQNIQFNWPQLKDIPDILDDLAGVRMHAIQTSGNCIRNVTSDPLAGVAADEIEDPRPTAELIRQWSSLHPEFTFLGRKFKIAVTGAENDRAAVAVHDVGLRIVRGPDGEIGYRVLVGGGLGRTPMIAKTLREFLPRAHLLPYLEATLRVYNLLGRRDNKYKARIKILVHEMGIDAFRAAVEDEFARLDPEASAPDPAEVARIAAYFAPPAYPELPDACPALERARRAHPEFDAWVRRNVHPHKVPGHAAATISLKPIGGAPGDATAEQMRLMADVAERHSMGELRITHEQNVVLPHLRKDELFQVWRMLASQGLDAPNRGLVTDIIACPGLDYCALATARSIPVAQAISRRFADPALQERIGPLAIKISGCINACGHHHVGHIGILGLDKAGVESYQITLGGDPTDDAALGERTGPGFAFDQVPDVVETLVRRYLELRQPGETFLQTYRRLGMTPFKEALYAAA